MHFHTCYGRHHREASVIRWCSGGILGFSFRVPNDATNRSFEKSSKSMSRQKHRKERPYGSVVAVMAKWRCDASEQK